MASVDDLYWRQLARCSKFHPEVELIRYCVDKGSREFPGIGPHVDNASVITLVAMLSERSEYSRGGARAFESVSGEAARTLSLNCGDVVIFRGEKTEHWIEDVTGGERVILQIEYCRAKAGRH